MRRWVTPGLSLALLMGLLLIIYWPGFSGKWFLDDFGNIHDNANIHAATLSWQDLHPAVFGRDTGHHRLDRPVAYLTLAANFAIGGTDPAGYHIVNFLIHFITSVVIYLLAVTTLNTPEVKPRYGGSAHAIGLLGTLLWAIHPIQVTAVTYIVQRMAALAALFSLAALLCFARGRLSSVGTRKAAWYVTSLVWGLMAFGSKQSAVMLPVSVALYAWVFFPPPPGTGFRPGRWLLPSAAVVTVVLIAAHQVGTDFLVSGYQDRPFTLAQRLLTEPRVIWFYVWLLIYPISSQFALLHDFQISTGIFSPWTTVPALVMLAAAAIVAIRQRTRQPLLSIGILFFIINHAVEGSILPLEIVFEHRNYLPSVFLFLAGAAGILGAVDHFAANSLIQRLAIACMAVVLIAAGHTTRMRNELFTDRVALWYQNVLTYPDLHRPRHNLGRALIDAGDYPDGLTEMLASLNHRSGARRSQKLVTYYNLGLAYRAIGDVEDAEKAFHQVVALASHHEGSWIQLAYIALERHRFQQAMAIADRIAATGGKGFHYHTITGLAALGEGDISSARVHARQALALPWQDASVFCLYEHIAAAAGKSAQTAYFGRQCPFRQQRKHPEDMNTTQ